MACVGITWPFALTHVIAKRLKAQMAKELDDIMQNAKQHTTRTPILRLCEEAVTDALSP